MKRSLEAVRYSGAGLFFMGAALLAILAGLAVYGYLSSIAPTKEVVTAVSTLPPGTLVSAKDLMLTKLPAAAVPEKAILDLKAVVGRRLLYGLVAGSVVREEHLVAKSQSHVAQLVGDLGDEYRAIMLPGDQVPAVSRLMRGDRLELTGVVPDRRNDSTVATPIGVATVLEVYGAQSQSDGSAVLVAMKAAELTKVALAMRVGTLMVALQGNGNPAPPSDSLRLEALIETGSGAGAGTGSSATLGAGAATGAGAPGVGASTGAPKGTGTSISTGTGAGAGGGAGTSQQRPASGQGL